MNYTKLTTTLIATVASLLSTVIAPVNAQEYIDMSGFDNLQQEMNSAPRNNNQAPKTVLPPTKEDYERLAKLDICVDMVSVFDSNQRSFDIIEAYASGMGGSKYKVDKARKSHDKYFKRALQECNSSNIDMKNVELNYRRANKALDELKVTYGF